MGDLTVAILAAGWLLQLSGFAVALARAGRRAAGPGEWAREAALRVGMLVLLALALVDPGPPRLPLPPAARGALLALYGAGQLLATWARATLGPAWGLGIAPRAAPVRRGPYRRLGHPIYAGTGLALAAQAAIQQNPPALALAALAALVIPAKAAAEARRLRR